MIILPDRTIPRADVLVPVKRKVWTPSQRSATYGIETQNRWKLTARLRDGHVAWKGYFDDRDDADAFLAALIRHQTLGDPMPREIIQLVAEDDRRCYDQADWSPLLTEQQATYNFEALCFLTANPGSLQEWIVPDDWRDPLHCPPFTTVDALLAWSGSPAYLTSGTSSSAPGDFSSTNTIECIGGGGGSSRTGGGGGAYAKSVNLTGITGSITYQVGAAGAASGAGTDTWFNSASFPASGQKCGAKAGGAGSGTTGAASGGASGSCYYTGTGSLAYSGGGSPQLFNSSGAGGCGGGGAAGPNGAGADAGVGYDQGSGGGGHGGGSAGKSSGSSTSMIDSPGGNGGNNYLGTGGGAGSTAGNNGGAGSAGGGGGGTPKTSAVTAGAGGAGQEWDSTHGSGGGGGGAGYLATPGAAALYGAGSGGAPTSGGSAIGGAQGIVVITYTAAGGIMCRNLAMLGM